MKDLEKYRKGSMTEEELDHFSGKLIAAKLDQDLKNKWAHQLAGTHGVERGPQGLKRSVWRKFYPWTLGVAASLLLLALVLPGLWKSQKGDPVALADFYLDRENFSDPSVRGGDSPDDQLRVQARNAFNQGQFKEAITFRKKVIASNNADIQDYFFLALSYLNDGQAAKSIPVFEKTLELAPENEARFAQEAAWFIALAHLKTGNPEAGKNALLHIKTNDWRYPEAQTLLRQLEIGN